MKDKKKDIKVFGIIAICIIILISIIYYQFETGDKAYSVAYDIGEVKSKYNSEVENIHEGLEIGQTFISKENNLGKIYINFSKVPNARNNTTVGGNAIVGLKDENKNVIAEKKIAFNHVRVNNNYEFEFPVQKESENKEYYLYVKFLNLEENYTKYFTILYSKQDLYKDGNMYINNVKADGDILFQEFYYHSNIKLLFNLIVIIITIIISILIITIYYIKNITPEKLFLYIVPIIMLLGLLIMPTLKSHDEVFHWTRIYDIAQGNLFTKKEDGIPKAIFPKEVDEIRIYDQLENLRYTDLKKQFEYKISEDSKKIVMKLSTTAIYSPVQYVPQAIGVFIVSKISNSPMLMAYAARAFNIIATILILYFAIKLIPFGKKTLLVLICIPIVLEGFVSMSPDAITVSTSFLFIAYVLKLLNERDKKITVKDKVVLLILSIIIALCKIVYLPIVGLMLILPKEKFKTRKEQVLTIATIMGIAIIVNLGWLLVSATYLSTFRGGDSKYQLLSILQNPIEYVQRLFSTINLYGRDYIYLMFGGELGWNEYLKMHSIVPITLEILYLFFSCTEEDSKNRFNKFQTAIIVLISLAVIGLVFTSLYIQWTPVTYDIIYGVQGRYFVPILPLISIGILSKLKIKNNYTEENKLKVLGITILILYTYVFLNTFLTNL